MNILSYEVDTRTKQQQYEDGFNLFCDVARSGDYLCEAEISSLTEAEMRGYNNAIQAADAAEYAEWHALAGNRNAYGDLTNY